LHLQLVETHYISQKYLNLLSLIFRVCGQEKSCQLDMCQNKFDKSVNKIPEKVTRKIFKSRPILFATVADYQS